jgi:hypothetical protein
LTTGADYRLTSPPGRHDTLYTSPPSPCNTCPHSPFAADQILTVPSPEPEAIDDRDGDVAQSHIREVWPDKVCRSDPSEMDDIRSVVSLPSSSISGYLTEEQTYLDPLTINPVPVPR